MKYPDLSIYFAIKAKLLLKINQKITKTIDDDIFIKKNVSVKHEKITKTMKSKENKIAKTFKETI